MIVEQSIHNIDVDTWILNGSPVSATGQGGLRVRPVGSCFDHMTVLYQYENDVGVAFSHRQFKGHGTSEGIRNRVFGSQGVLETEYGEQVLIRGEGFYRGGRTSGIYQQGAVRNIATFHSNISEGRFDNPTVKPSVRSNLVSILGRNAAYQGKTLKWQDLLDSREVLHADLDGLRA